MKKIVSVLLLIAAVSAFADTPVGPMNYQGRLLDSAGVPVTGSYNFVVRVYDAVNAGTLKYQENHNAVAVDDGVYALLVGTQAKSGGDSTWSVELWNCCSALYLEVVVNGEALAPRHRLSAAPYAFQANLALTTNNALALGGKPSAWYGSTLEAICASGKGKWLELANAGAGACLGAGAEYPGPSVVALSTLTASSDLRGIDLTRANVSGIDFGTANLSGAVFKDTTIKASGFANANLTDAIFDGTITSGNVTFTVNASFANAKLSNMNLSGWDMASTASLTGISAALLTGCPFLPAGFSCKGKDIGGGSWRYFIVGPGVNLSNHSLMSGKLNTQYTDQWSFQDSDLRGINYSGNNLESVSFPPYYTTDMSNSNFKGASVRNTKLPGTLSGTSFDGATLVSTEFYLPVFSPIAPTFDNAELKFVLFNGPANDTVLTFTNAILSNIEIRGSGIIGYGQNISFSASASRIDTLAISSTLSALTIINSTVVGGINAHSSNPLGAITIGGPAGEGTTFMGGNISGRFYNANFTNSVFYGTTFRGALLTGATGLLSANLINVDWFGAVCPDGYSVTTPGGSCVGHGI